MSLISLQTFQRIANQCPCESAIGSMLQLGENIFDTQQTLRWSLFFESSFDNWTKSLTNFTLYTLFALYIPHLIIEPIATYNLFVGASHLTIACIRSFREKNSEQPNQIPIRAQFYTSFVHVAVATYDFVIKWFLTSRIGFVIALAFAFSPNNIKTLHQSVFKKINLTVSMENKSPGTPSLASNQPASPAQPQVQPIRISAIATGRASSEEIEEVFDYPWRLDPLCYIHIFAMNCAKQVKGIHLPEPPLDISTTTSGERPLVGPELDENTSEDRP